MRALLLFAGIGLTLPVLGQQNLNVKPPVAEQPPPNKMLYAYLRGAAHKHFDSRRAEVAALKTPQDVEKRQQYLKAQFLAALGGFPSKTSLHPQVIGTLKGDGYRVERIIYESRPDHHVTANLYVPDGPGPFPGVLMPLGHYANGKAGEEVQRGCILFAKNGLAVLAYDPIGQGERRQVLDAKGKPAVGSNTTEHTLVGIGALLIGESTATYRIWDGIRSLDYLASRPEVDPKRLGCTGCSGGGTLTSYLMALDDRILAAVPSCYITTFERLFDTIGPQDAEQNISGQVAFGMDHADYVTMRAPRPTLLCAATKDFFDIQGTWTAYREAAQTYGLMGYPERVAIVEANTGHGYSKLHREAAARWLCRWLAGNDVAISEPNFPIAKDEVLQCTRSGQVLLDFKGKSTFQLNAERAAQLAKARAAEFSQRKTPELLAAVRQLIALPKDLPAARLLQDEKLDWQGYAGQHVLFETERGIGVSGWWFKPKTPPTQPRLVVYIHEGGKAADAGPGGALAKMVAAGDEVLALDLRGFGATTPGRPSKKPGLLGSDTNEAFLALHLNRPLLGQRVYDVLTVVKHLGTAPAGSKLPIHIVGVGAAGPVVLHAAALEPGIRSVEVQHSVVSWQVVAQTALTINQLANVVPGALKTYDLPDLCAAIAPRPLTLSQVANARSEPLPQAERDDALAPVRAAYEQLGAADRLAIAK